MRREVGSRSRFAATNAMVCVSCDAASRVSTYKRVPSIIQAGVHIRHTDNKYFS